MDELIQAQQAGEPVMVEIDSQMTRVCAELFKIEGGIAFVDVGWNDQYGCSGHPIHIVRGPITQEGQQWTILEHLDEGRAREFVFGRIPEDHKQMAQWRTWEREKNKQGKPYDREIIKRAVEQLINY